MKIIDIHSDENMDMNGRLFRSINTLVLDTFNNK